MSHDAPSSTDPQTHSAADAASGSSHAASHAIAGHGGHADHHANHPHVNYAAIFGLLCICTLLSVVFDVVKMRKEVVVVLVLAVAVAKAQFVMRYFMHLKFEGLWKYVLLLPTAILACGLPLALAPDIALHYYTPEYVARGEVGENEPDVKSDPPTDGPEAELGTHPTDR